jgi:hypothetical protein
MVTTFSLLLALSGQAPPCVCPANIGGAAGDPPIAFVAASGNQPGLVACGYSERATVGLTSEFEVFSCGSPKSLLTFGALESAFVEVKGEQLIATQVSRWPFGRNWQWVWVPMWRYMVTRGAPPRVDRMFILQAPSLSPEEVKEALALYSRNRQPAPQPENYEDIIGRVLAAALAGSGEAQWALAHMRNAIVIDGHAGEVWQQAEEFYQSYARETGRVPPLPGA